MAGKGGARPGAGAPRGPRKATIEKALIAEREIEGAKASGRKLAKEYLQEFLPVLAGMAAWYQPTFPGMVQQNQHGDEAKFEKWYRLFAETATRLAPFESPTFRAVMVAPPPPQKPGAGRVTVFTLTIFDEEHGQQPPAPKVVEHSPSPGS